MARSPFGIARDERQHVGQAWKLALADLTTALIALLTAFWIVSGALVAMAVGLFFVTLTSLVAAFFLRRSRKDEAAQSMHPRKEAIEPEE
jgi:flagellar motor protein MotB